MGILFAKTCFSLKCGPQLAKSAEMYYSFHQNTVAPKCIETLKATLKYEYHCNKNKIAAFILKKISRSTLFNQNKSFDLFDKVFGHFIVVKWQSIL